MPSRGGAMPRMVDGFLPSPSGSLGSCVSVVAAWRGSSSGGIGCVCDTGGGGDDAIGASGVISGSTGFAIASSVGAVPRAAMASSRP